MHRSGVSYIIGLLIILGVTLAAVVIYSSIVGFQARTIQASSAIDVRRTGESLVVVLAHRNGQIVVYNNGIIPTCVAAITLVETGATTTFPSCVNVNPQQYATINFLATPWSPGQYTLLIRTATNKLMTFRVQVR